MNYEHAYVARREKSSALSAGGGNNKQLKLGGEWFDGSFFEQQQRTTPLVERVSRSSRSSHTNNRYKAAPPVINCDTALTDHCDRSHCQIEHRNKKIKKAIVNNLQFAVCS